MNKLIRLILIGCAVMVMIGPVSAGVPGSESDPKKEKDLFVLKTEKNLVGATVDIYSAKGNVMTSQILKKRKVIIDFSDVKDGFYLIRVSKGTHVKEFQYRKNKSNDSKA